MNIVNNKFNEAEKLGRIKFKKLFMKIPEVKNITFTTGKYDRIDATFMYKGKKIAVEIKNRTAMAFNYDTLLMEKGKYKALKEAEKIYDTVLYVTFIEDKECYVYNLSKLKKLTFNYMRTNNTTAVYTGKSYKEMAEISKKDAMYKFVTDNNNNWRVAA